MAGGRTYADRREYLIKAVQRRRKEVRRKAIAHTAIEKFTPDCSFHRKLWL